MAGRKVFLIPDTNTLIHYRFEEVRWRELLQADEVEVCLCPQVIEEVARLKDMGEKKAIRKRAAHWCQKISQLANDRVQTLRAGETISVHSNHPDLSKWNGLNEKSQDDRVIAFALELKSQKGGDVVVATADVSLGLRIRLNEHKITSISLPENKRLEIADEEEKRIKHLESELARFKSAQPQLVAHFDDNSPILKVRLHSSDDLSILAKVEGEKAEQEARRKHPHHVAVPHSSFTSLMMSGGEPRTEKEVREFNARLDEYYRKVNEHLQRGIMLYRRIVEIKLQLSNQGSVPASSVHAYFHFPDGFILCGEQKFLSRLEDEPEPPLTQNERLSATLRRSFELQASHSLHPLLALNSHIEGELSIEKSNSYDVTTEFSKIRQGEIKKIKTLYAIFKDKPKSFTIQYRLTTDNALQIVEGQLSVVVEEE